ncbi:MAG: DUF2461 domain-containing protein [Flavobacteriales bacterium]|nr:DUF2461 domain-containing protein [Flavobacteriales bacterium]MCB9167926.1 DUF2461 domain-containing protein [Flavobacteriales bacterium]
MAWFAPDFNRFFKDLAANNNKEWFNANRTRYERSVKKPFEEFVAEMIRRIHAVDKDVNIEPKDAIFRINRDIRFSKDKTPYKLSRAAIISPKGRMDHGIPGIYFEIGPEAIRVYGGRYMPEKEDLQRIREHIAADPRKFRTLHQAPGFARAFGEVLGEKNKVLPKEFRKAADQEPLLYNKQFYYGAELPAGKVTDPGLVETFMDYYAAMRPMNRFLMLE